MTQLPPHRRWFQFSLGTMFIVVTAFAILIAYDVNVIHQRRAAKYTLLQHDALVFTEGSEAKVPPFARPSGVSSNPTGKIPYHRRLFGDEAVLWIIVVEEDDYYYAEAQFPEAIVALSSREEWRKFDSK